MNNFTEKPFCLPCDLEATKRPLSLYPEFDFIRGNRTKVPSCYSTGWRIMPFHLCTMGFRPEGGMSTLEVKDQETINVAGNDFLFVPAGTPHRFTENEHGECESVWLHFRATFSGGIDLFSLYEITAFHVTEPEQVERFAALLNKLILLPKYAGIADSIQLQITGMTLLDELLAFATPKVFPKSRENDIERLKKVLTMLRSASKMPQTQELAKLTNLSASRFLAVFHEVIGASPGHYWQQQRHERACRMLLSDLSILEIAAILGYADSCHFSRNFKSFAGMSPRDYRKQCLGD